MEKKGGGRGARLRIASLAPDATSILEALGARENLVAVSRWCHEVANTRGLPKLGDCWNLETKPLAALSPDYIIGSVPFRPSVVEKLLQLPATFVALNPRSLAGIRRDIEFLGRLTGRNKEAKGLVTAMAAAFAAIHRRARRFRERPRVYCEAWPNPRISSPPWVAELVEIAGGRMVAGAGKSIDDDEVARTMPDIIVLAWTATGDHAKPQTALRNIRWKNVPAVMHRRVFVIRDELLNTPGPPLVKGAEALLQTLHPGA